jgi:hypothetical protein
VGQREADDGAHAIEELTNNGQTGFVAGRVTKRSAASPTSVRASG